MPVEVFEKHFSRNGKYSPETPSIDVVYGVHGTDDETEVDSNIATFAPPFWSAYQGAVGVQVLTLQGWDRNYLGNGNWDVTVHYDRTDPKGPGTVHVSLDFTAGQQKIYQSLRTVTSQAINSVFDGATSEDILLGDGPDCRGAIGVTDHGVEGTDIAAQKMEFTLTVVALAEALPGDYLNQLRACAPSVNSDVWTIAYQGQTLTFDPGEALFLGGPAQFRGDGFWEFSWKFSGSKNVSNINVGGSANTGPANGPLIFDPWGTVATTYSGGMTFAIKNGWDWLWVRFQEGPDPATSLHTRRPKAAYIEQVYPYTSFNYLFNRNWITGALL